MSYRRSKLSKTGKGEEGTNPFDRELPFHSNDPKLLSPTNSEIAADGYEFVLASSSEAPRDSFDLDPNEPRTPIQQLTSSREQVRDNIGSASPLNNADARSRKPVKYRRNEEGEKIYAGLTHSDLDIQCMRPPLMHQMNFIEWIWLQSKSFHRFIFMLLGVLISIIIINLVFAIVLIANGGSRRNPYECHSNRCHDLAENILLKLNKQVDPCEDFYAFVCGSSEYTKGLSQEQEDNWAYGHHMGRVVYDFYRSVSLGRMLKPVVNEFPHNQILPFYKACLDEISREQHGLRQYYDALRLFGLYNVDKNGNHQANDVVISIASMLAYSFHTASIIKDEYDFDSRNDKLRLKVLPSYPGLFLDSNMVMYGYNLYRDTVKKSFQLLTELRVDPADLEVIVDDVVCLDLYLKQKVTILSTGSGLSKSSDVLVILDEFGQKFSGGQHLCIMDVPSPANFGKPVITTPFDYTLMAKTIYQLVNPDWNPTMPFPIIVGNPSQDTDSLSDMEFLEIFEIVFANSAPHRLLRYLQWRLFYRLAFDLDTAVKRTLMPIKRHYKSGVPYCIQQVFTWLPFAASDRYLHSIRGSSMKQLDREFRNVMHLVRLTYFKLIVRGKFTEYPSALPTLTSGNVELFREILAGALKSDAVPPVMFEDDRSFPLYHYLYVEISLSETNHFQNLMDMGYRQQEWKLNPRFKDFYYREIDPAFHALVWMDKSHAVYNSVPKMMHRIYIPFAAIEEPYFRAGLGVTDISGAAMFYSDAIERALNTALQSAKLKDLMDYLLLDRQLPGAAVRDSVVKIIKFIFRVAIDFYDTYTKYEGEVGGNRKIWIPGQIVSSEVTSQILLSLQFDQRHYHALSLVAEDVLRQPHNWKHRKALLPGLEEFDSMQLFYITLVQSRCENLPKKKFDHIVKYGPLSQAMQNNIVLRNLQQFASAFNCPLNSTMNPADKVYFWDRDVNISQFSINETDLSFLV